LKKDKVVSRTFNGGGKKDGIESTIVPDSARKIIYGGGTLTENKEEGFQRFSLLGFSQIKMLGLGCAGRDKKRNKRLPLATLFERKVG